MSEMYISFLSDFGLADETVAVCKGVIISKAPETPIIDISHMVPPFDIISGGWILAGVFPQMPAGIHLAVVDPGVGSSRAIIIVETARGDIFIGPDNGLLIPALQRLGGSLSVHRVDDKWILRKNISATFHGRDVMAPIAGSLAAGRSPSDFGHIISSEDLCPYPVPVPHRSDNSIEGHVTLIDHFGTLRTNIPWETVGDSMIIPVGKENAFWDLPRVNTFSDVPRGKLCVLEDSWGYLSIAVNQGRAVDIIRLNPGDALSVKLTMK
jgi:hypothetical protein